MNKAECDGVILPSNKTGRLDLNKDKTVAPLPAIETLKIDIDLRDFDKVESIILNRAGSVFNIVRIKPLDVKVYSTARGFHIYLTIEGEYTSFDVCFLQMALGSDYKREAFNFYRFKNSLDKKWNILFSKKYDGAGNLISYEKYELDLSKRLWASISERCNRGQ